MVTIIKSVIQTGTLWKWRGALIIILADQRSKLRLPSPSETWGSLCRNIFISSSVDKFYFLKNKFLLSDLHLSCLKKVIANTINLITCIIDIHAPFSTSFYLWFRNTLNIFGRAGNLRLCNQPKALLTSQKY